MIHDQARVLLDAYVDGQLGPVRRLVVRRHAERCPTCLAAIDGLQDMRAALRTTMPAHRAPPALASRIGGALGREVPPPSRRRAMRLRFAGTALGGGLAGAVAGAVLTVGVTGIGPRGAPLADPLAEQAVSDHIRSMMADHLTDVPSSDRHSVKPWLAARLDLSPVVRDLAEQGFPMAGGRLDYLAGRRAAALVYHSGGHVINLFALVSDQTADAPPSLTAKDGFNVVRWRMGGLTYVAVSDVEAPRLLRFAELVRTSG